MFCLILFMYLHIQFHLKKGNELEIFEVENLHKEKIEEICDLRQPVLFEIADGEEAQRLMEITSKTHLIKNYPMFDVKIRNTKEKKEDVDKGEIYEDLKFMTTEKLLNEDKEAKFITENNEDFLRETGTLKNMKYNDELFRPNLLSNSKYDFIYGSENSATPFRYETYYRNYFIITQGSARIKLTPPKNTKYLYMINDYENYEFRSPIDPWNPQDTYKQNFDKVKCLEIIMLPGKCIQIPPYWLYSFKFIDKDTSITCLKYNTYMSNVSLLPQYIMYYFQNNNITKNYVSPLVLGDGDNDDMDEEHIITKNKNIINHKRKINGKNINEIV